MRLYEKLRSRGEEYSLHFVNVRTLPNSRNTLIVGEYARKVGKNEEYTDAVFKAIFKIALTSEKKGRCRIG